MSFILYIFRYTSLLLIVIPSLNQFITGPIPHREPVLFPQDNHYKDILPGIVFYVFVRVVMIWW
jgi:hypothetical protein